MATKDLNFNEELAKTPTGRAALKALAAFNNASAEKKDSAKAAYMAAMAAHLTATVTFLPQ